MTEEMHGKHKFIGSTSETAVDKPNPFATLEALGADLDRSAVLEKVSTFAAESIGADVGFVGLLDPSDHLEIVSLHGCTGDRLNDLRVARGSGLGGKVVAQAQAESVFDYPTASEISHEYDEIIASEGLRGVMGVPLVLGGQLAGVAYVSSRTPIEYSDVMLDRVLDAVSAAEMALSFAERSARLAEMAVTRERARTAATLDDELGDLLRGILRSARSILTDPASSVDLVANADGIVTAATAARSALQRSIDGLHEGSVAAGSCPLSPRELDVVRLASQGLSNPEIGERLHLARGTVKSYMETALVKLDSRNRVEAVMTAKTMGLI